MGVVKNLFGKKTGTIKSYEDFWNWFQKNERSFFNAVKEQVNIEKIFFAKLSNKLAEIKEGFFYLTGMHNDDTVELILTADGTVKNIVFIEELINAAPKIDGWKFTALKPALDIKDVSIEMAGYTFNEDNLSFYYNNLTEYPDEIDITIVHNDLTEENKTVITNGTYLFLDNYLGELDFATTIDNVNIVGKEEARQELVSMCKLKDFLVWRQKEFIEKYEGTRHNTDDDKYSALQARLNNGHALFAVINTDLLEWDAKASHPWILNIEIKYEGKKNGGMPDEKTFKVLDEIEHKIGAELQDFEGYLNIGRQTAEGCREIYFACKDFRKPSKVLHMVQGDYSGKIEMSYDIYKDKYWRSFDRFIVNR